MRNEIRRRRYGEREPESEKEGSGHRHELEAREGRREGGKPCQCWPSFNTSSQSTGRTKPLAGHVKLSRGSAGDLSLFPPTGIGRHFGCWELTARLVWALVAQETLGAAISYFRAPPKLALTSKRTLNRRSLVRLSMLVTDAVWHFVALKASSC